MCVLFRYILHNRDEGEEHVDDIVDLYRQIEDQASVKHHYYRHTIIVIINNRIVKYDDF